MDNGFNNLSESQFDRYANARICEIEQKVKEKRKQRNRQRLNNSLKPCPFCGGKAEILNYQESDGPYIVTYVKVICVNCYASTQSRICSGLHNCLTGKADHYKGLKFRYVD